MPEKEHRRDRRSRSGSKQPASSAPALLLLNKPFDVLSQFTDTDNRPTLANYVNAPGYYPAGRLDRDSEGLLLLTNDGALQQKISHPRFKLTKTYLAQVEGEIDQSALTSLNRGIELNDGPARAINARSVEQPKSLWPRNPPVRFRKHIPTSWLELSLREGRNRQVRRMTAHVGFPTLRLIRTSIGKVSVWPIALGQYRAATAEELLG